MKIPGGQRGRGDPDQRDAGREFGGGDGGGRRGAVDPVIDGRVAAGLAVEGIRC